MISRSVPGYDLMLNLISLLTQQFAVPGTNCYDLGCSLGEASLRIRQQLPASCQLVCVDNSPDMIERCRTRLESAPKPAGTQGQPGWTLQLADIQDTPIDKASLVVLNFTLQFLPDSQRQGLLQRIHAGLVTGGVLFLAEKLSFNSSHEQALMTGLHESFKKANGYSDLEIAQKRNALEDVLVPNDLQTHFARLAQAGFAQTTLLAQALNFAGILAVK